MGLFRKSGVKSRIQALRQMNESSPENVSYEDQSAYDVADMVKQFFRDLPEPLLTSKLGETFLHIYQCMYWICFIWLGNSYGILKSFNLLKSLLLQFPELPKFLMKSNSKCLNNGHIVYSKPQWHQHFKSIKNINKYMNMVLKNIPCGHARD